MKDECRLHQTELLSNLICLQKYFKVEIAMQKIFLKKFGLWSKISRTFCHGFRRSSLVAAQRKSSLLVFRQSLGLGQGDGESSFHVLLWPFLLLCPVWPGILPVFIWIKAAEEMLFIISESLVALHMFSPTMGDVKSQLFIGFRKKTVVNHQGV